MKIVIDGSSFLFEAEGYEEAQALHGFFAVVADAKEKGKKVVSVTLEYGKLEDNLRHSLTINIA